MNRNIIHIVQSEIFKVVPRFSFLSKADVDILVNNLHSGLISLNYYPDVIVGISSGGNYASARLSDKFGVPLKNVHISHYNISFCGLDLDEIVGVYSVARLFNYKPNTFLKNNVDGSFLKDKSVLLVDDDSYSGFTLRIAKNAILEHEPKSLKSIVLHTYFNNAEVDFAGKFYEKREFYNLKLRFPWSKISPHFKSGYF
ncbi:MAG: phosphoribosyltransferase family protein [Candidatus Woesearchaeota archaeon]